LYLFFIANLFFDQSVAAEKAEISTSEVLGELDFRAEADLCLCFGLFVDGSPSLNLCRDAFH